MANTFNLGNGNWAQKTEKLLAYNAENDNYKPLPFDFDRGSTATRVNRDGLIETVGTDEPRIDFLNNTKGHLLLEPQRTNYVVYSETEGIIYGSNGWTGNLQEDAVVTRNYGTTPFSGTELKSTRLQYSGSNKDFRNEFSAVTIQACATVWIKGTSGETIKFGTTSNQSVFTLTGDWQKIEQIDSTSRSSSRLTINTYSGATARDIEIYAPQVEAGSYATSYIPTSGSAVTRSADVCNNAGNSNVFNDSEGVLYAEIAALADDNTSRRISISDGSSNPNNLVCVDMSEYTNQIIGRVRTGNTEVAFLVATSQTQTQNNKIAVLYKQNDFKLFINGTQVATDTSGNTPTGLVDLSFDRGNGNNDFYGNVKDVRVYNTALSDSELQALTT